LSLLKSKHGDYWRSSVFAQRECAQFHFVCNKSSTAAVIACTPVLIAGSGAGANLLEWSDGKAAPFCRLSASLPDSTVPNQNMQMGILGSTRPYCPKSSKIR
jgi:hypothetical protein